MLCKSTNTRRHAHTCHTCVDAGSTMYLRPRPGAPVHAPKATLFPSSSPPSPARCLGARARSCPPLAARAASRRLPRRRCPQGEVWMPSWRDGPAGGRALSGLWHRIHGGTGGAVHTVRTCGTGQTWGNPNFSLIDLYRPYTARHFTPHLYHPLSSFSHPPTALE